MQLHFDAISEPSLPGPKWQKLFKTHWPAYKNWLDSKDNSSQPDLETSQAALKRYMPEMWLTYQRLCKISKADETAARFLTGFQPPAYISACSQAVLTGKETRLVRNYDYHPNLMEGTQLLSAWNGKKVIATSDCLIGAIDGINEDGLAISLTFGGRKVVGVGFGIPFILRYVLEFCSNVDEAVAALARIPSHMSYNVTVLDKSGSFKTVRLAPDRLPVVTDDTLATNHQGTIDWPENAAFNKTVERAAFLEKLLLKRDTTADTLADAFLQPPLYNRMFKEGFGTLFTAAYNPAEGTVELLWPGENLQQSFEDFSEESRIIYYDAAPAAAAATQWNRSRAGINRSAVRPYGEASGDYAGWQEIVSNTLVIAMAQANPAADKEQLETLRGKLINRGEISWKALADFWSNTGTGY